MLNRQWSSISITPSRLFIHVFDIIGTLLMEAVEGGSLKGSRPT
jgi:hypothetical protein